MPKAQRTSPPPDPFDVREAQLKRTLSARTYALRLRKKATAQRKLEARKDLYRGANTCVCRLDGQAGNR